MMQTAEPGEVLKLRQHALSCLGQGYNAWGDYVTVAERVLAERGMINYLALYAPENP